MNEAPIETRDDEQWQTAVADYRAAKADADAANDTLRAKRAALIECAGEAATEDFGLCVVLATRDGRINYRPEDIRKALAGLNLADYRSAPSEYWTIKEVAE
jgi:hypothetical protein